MPHVRRDRKDPKASKVRRDRKVRREKQALQDRKALTASKGYRGRKDRKVRREKQALQDHRVSVSKGFPVRRDRKVRREKQALQDHRVSVSKDRPDRKVRREKQALQGHKDHRVRKAKRGSKVLQVQPVKLAQQAAQQACMWSGRKTARTTTVPLPAARAKPSLLSPARAERYPSQRTGRRKPPRAATARDRRLHFACRP